MRALRLSAFAQKSKTNSYVSTILCSNSKVDAKLCSVMNHVRIVIYDHCEKLYSCSFCCLVLTHQPFQLHPSHLFCSILHKTEDACFSLMIVRGNIIHSNNSSCHLFIKKTFLFFRLFNSHHFSLSPRRSPCTRATRYQRTPKRNQVPAKVAVNRKNL